MSVTLTCEANTTAEQLPEILAMLKAVVPDTRAFEIWESRAHQEKYIAWRTETGDLEKLGPFSRQRP